MIITASIVTYHNPTLDIKKVIDSFLGSSVSGTLFIVDNSENRAIEKITNFPQINYIYNNANIGFGSAHNIAIKKSIEMGSEFHLILNPDIEFDPKIIPHLIQKFKTDNSIGLIMPKVLYPDGTIQHLCKLLPTPFNLLVRRFLPFKKLGRKQNDKYELRFFDYQSEAEIPSLSGCFMIIRTTKLKEIGGFDERFFMYLEDVDLCRRIGETSKLVYFPEVSITHNFEKGSYKNFALLKVHIISAIKYFNKWGWILDNKRKQINLKTLRKLEDGGFTKSNRK